jgi:hypothetical protein
LSADGVSEGGRVNSGMSSRLMIRRLAMVAPLVGGGGVQLELQHNRFDERISGVHGESTNFGEVAENGL